MLVTEARDQVRALDTVEKKLEREHAGYRRASSEYEKSIKLYNTGRVEQDRKGAYNSKLFHSMNQKMRATEERARALKATIHAMNSFMLNYK